MFRFFGIAIAALIVVGIFLIHSLRFHATRIVEPLFGRLGPVPTDIVIVAIAGLLIVSLLRASRSEH